MHVLVLRTPTNDFYFSLWIFVQCYTTPDLGGLVPAWIRHRTAAANTFNSILVVKLRIHAQTLSPPTMQLNVFPAAVGNTLAQNARPWTRIFATKTVTECACGCSGEHICQKCMSMDYRFHN